jgi:ribonucleoside-diphosphate reductase beta chain
VPVLAGYAHLLAAGRRAQWDEAGLRLVPAPGGGPDAVRRLVAGFCVAEQAVAEHLLPIAAAAADPQLREALELQAADEARHARFFARVADEALALEDPHALAGPELVALFGSHLPATAARVAAGEAGLGDGVGLYHLVLEVPACRTTPSSTRW